MMNKGMISLKEHQQIMLDILKDFAEFCDQNGLKYYLDAGTLLGAVRHQGFIPWDNDMDVCMMREDYDRMIQIARQNGGMLNDHIILEEPENTIYCFCKLGDIRTKLIEFPETYPEECYIYIDVFPKDGLKNLGVGTKAVCKISEILGLFHWVNKHTIPFWKTQKGYKHFLAIMLDFFIIDKNIAFKAQKRLICYYSKKNPMQKCDYVTTLVIGEYNCCCPKSCWKDSAWLTFENSIFCAPKGYATWLKTLYGKDYMTPPPPEKRRVHKVNAFFLTESDADSVKEE